MLIKKLPLALLSLVIGISGCYYKMGAKVDTDTIAQIEKGKTTRAQVESLLGIPKQKITQDGKEMYIYCYANVQHSGKMFIPVVGPFLSESAYEHQDIHILFNEKGIVESVQKIEGADTIGGPRLGR